MTDYAHVFAHEGRLRGKHAEELRPLQRLAEDCVDESLDRAEVIAHCLATFPRGCLVHPYTLGDAILMTTLDQTLRSAVRHHLATVLICANALHRYYNVANRTTTEPVATLLAFAPYDRAAFLRAVARLHVPLDAAAVADAARKRRDVPVPHGWRFEGVSVGTRPRRDAWVNPVHLKDAWCHNYLDETLREHDAHVYTARASRDPLYRRFVVRSVVRRAQTYLVLELPVVFYYRLPNGTRYGYLRHVQLCRVCLVDKEDPMHALRRHAATYTLTFRPERLPCLDLEGMARFHMHLFNDGTGRPYVAAFYAAVAHVASCVTKRALRALDAFDPFGGGTPPPSPLLHALGNMHGFRREVRHVYRATVDALIASFMLSRRGPHVTFVTPFTIEDHTV